jgi:hypothetical protein
VPFFTVNAAGLKAKFWIVTAEPWLWLVPPVLALGDELVAGEEVMFMVGLGLGVVLADLPLKINQPPTARTATITIIIIQLREFIAPRTFTLIAF